jgi:hypothetical protein
MLDDAPPTSELIYDRAFEITLGSISRPWNPTSTKERTNVN